MGASLVNDSLANDERTVLILPRLQQHVCRPTAQEWPASHSQPCSTCGPMRGANCDTSLTVVPFSFRCFLILSFAIFPFSSRLRSRGARRQRVCLVAESLQQLAHIHGLWMDLSKFFLAPAKQHPILETAISDAIEEGMKSCAPAISNRVVDVRCRRIPHVASCGSTSLG